jgi:oligosaccharide repeat unit polymerase
VWLQPPEVAQGVKVWWLSPVALVSLVALPTTWLSLAIADDRYRALWRTPKVVTLEWTVWFTVGLLVFVAGALVPSALSSPRRVAAWPGLAPVDIRLLERAATILFWLSVTGYAAFVALGARVGLSPGALWASLLNQELYDAGIEEQLGTVPGITTLTQLGIAFAVITGVLMASGRPRRKHLGRLAVVAILALVRAYFITERLAVLELIVPLVVVLVARMSRNRSGARRAAFLPAFMLPVVISIFAIFEYSRSWVFYAAQGGRSFPSFIIERFSGYYVTAYNNGQIRLLHQEETTLPYDVAAAFWTAPGVGSINLYRGLTGVDYESSSTRALTEFGNPEFNNAGGVASPFVDLGLTGGILYYLVAGIVCGVLYRGLQEGRLWGLLLYPLIVLTLLELPRYFFIAQGRAAPSIVALAFVALMVNRSRRRRIGVRL